MITVEEILNRLAAGETTEDIAAEMTSILNEATSKHDANSKCKLADFSNAVDHALMYIQTWYPDLFASFDLTTLDYAELMDEIDDTLEFSKELLDIVKELKKIYPKEK